MIADADQRFQRLPVEDRTGALWGKAGQEKRKRAAASP
jgi:hypothetical protein